ncbi:MAG: hypothetical protein L0Y56_04420, partial [Nitrospira sp.]|nr:hypothetical protein [Nitrospira sp.]
ADEFFSGWTEIFENVILARAKKGSNSAEIKQAWLDVADKIEASGGRPHDLPPVVINNLGSVRGLHRELPNKAGIARMSEAFFDRLFMSPTNYRRGWLADLTRVSHTQRLETLFASQGRRIVSDAEMEALLGLQGISGAQRTGLRGALQEAALKAGVIPRSYIDDMVERLVLQEIENTLYAFDSGSRLGAQARAVFPFGKPWADMAGFYGREVFRRPVMRGWINERMAAPLRFLNNLGVGPVSLLPNRTGAALSRLAHTDFTIDKGFLHGDGGVLPGSEESDFRPLFFLPTDGSNPLSYMLPGLGIVPLTFLDTLVANKYDPLEEPEEYQNFIDNLSQFFPSLAYQSGGSVSRVLGGGTASRLLTSVVDLSGMVGNDSYFNLTSFIGDISRELDRTREISALLADPNELEMLLAAETAEEAELLLMALAAEADRKASSNHLAETISRYMAPVRNVYDAELAEIRDVWIDAGDLEPFIHLMEGRDPRRMSNEDLRSLANDIRTAFFKLPAWQRDSLIVQQPSLAVNLVGSWDWTPQAINENL